MVDATAAQHFPSGPGASTVAHHTYRYQVSASLFGKRFYFALLAGPERRSEERVKADGQSYPLWRVFSHIFITYFILHGAWVSVKFIGLSLAAQF